MSLDQPQIEEEAGEEMSFLDHLEVLRWHLVRSVIAIGLGMVLAFVFKSIVFDTIILAPKNSSFITYRIFCKLSHIAGLGEGLCFEDIQFYLINISMAGQFSMHIITSLIAGLILAFPYVLYEFWRFVKPALHQSERKYARGIVFWGSFLFITGVLFGYFLITPLSVQFLGNYVVSELVTNQINLNSYITTVTSITFACGIIFQLPVIVYFLAKFGIITPQFMRTYRRHAIVVVLILSAIITPPDVSSQILVCLPLLLLYEISILIAKRVERKEQAAG